MWLALYPLDSTTMVSAANPRRTRIAPLLALVAGLVCLPASFMVGLFIGLNSKDFVDSTLDEKQVEKKVIVTLMPVTANERGRIRDESAVTRPSWKVSLDCSIFSLDCPMRRQYEPYPFDFWDRKKYPESSMNELNQTLQIPKERYSKMLNQKQPVSKEQETKCLKYVRDTPFDQQLDAMLLKLSRSLNRYVAYTMSDIEYAKYMIHDVFAMAHNIVGFPDSFFMVAIDDATLELGCRFGYPTLPSPRSGDLEDRVKLTKFQVSLDLLKRGQDFMFFEMDVWFFKSMLPFLQNQFGDFLCSSHQNAPHSMNIGVYAVNANNATREYFQHCLDVALTYPIHDQRLMQQLKHDSENQQIGDEVIPDHPNVTFQYYVDFELLGSHEIASSEWPRPTIETIAIHPLSEQPLMGPHGKIQVAKELGVYYGSNGYYSTEQGRYLWLDRLDNSYSMVMNFHHRGVGAYHDGLAMKWTMAALIAIAKQTKRIWVLPRIQADIGRHFLWQILDMKTVEELGVEVRETSFLNNPKVSDFPSVSRTALGEGQLFWQEDEKETKVWRIEEINQFDTWLSLMKRMKSNALLLNPHIIDSSWYTRFRGEKDSKMDLTTLENDIFAVFSVLKWCDFACDGLNSSCPFSFDYDWSGHFWDEKRLSGARAATDCYGKGLLTEWK